MAPSRKTNKYKNPPPPEPTPVYDKPSPETTKSSSKSNEEALTRYMQEFCTARTRHIENARANALRQVFHLMHVDGPDNWSSDTFDAINGMLLPHAVFGGAPIFSSCKTAFDRGVLYCTGALESITIATREESEFARACPVLSPYYDHRFLWSMECDAMCEMLADALLVKKEPYVPLLDSGSQITWVVVLMHSYGPSSDFWYNVHLPGFGYTPLVMKS